MDVWASARWRELVVSWLDERLAAAGAVRTGAVGQPRVRPWATVVRVPTSAGPVWLKVTAPSTAAEVRLYPILREVVPDRVLPPVALDPERGWLLLPDAGPSLGDQVGGAELISALSTVLPRYGQLQRDLAPHADRLLAAGVADMRPASMPTRFAETLELVAGYAGRHGTEDDRAAVRTLASLQDTYAGWCAELAATPVPVTLDHNDLHPDNVVGDPARPRFYDWGDSVVGHPFASMLMGLGFLRCLGLAGPDSDPVLVRLRDAYLEPFGDLATRAELAGTLTLACRVAKVARALTWQRAVQSTGTAGDFADAPLRSLRTLLDLSALTVI
jgi:hypothetical protein